jgi:TolB-like protein/cytochrome c-type biogenesis protein CcmH/NrfG/predicted Ser/Thr protein kinase
MIPRTLGHYRILEQLGEGGMGRVYLAEDDRLGRRVALKLLPPEVAGDPDRRQRFEREARSLAALDHPGIVTVFAVEENDGHRFFTMERVAGRNLDALIPPDGLELERFFAFAAPLAEALGAAHEKGITHRDLKPTNVMVTDDGRVKVLDFGLAKAPPLGDASDDRTETLTEAGRLVGTLPYMAPEVARGLPADPRSDVFSLGVVLYQMVTGRRPFTGDSPADLLSTILRDAPPPLGELRPDLPEPLRRLILGCLEKDPRRRPQSGLDLRNRLEELRRQPASSTAGGEAAAPAPEPGRSIAVLPFTDMSPEGDQEYFCDGIAEELINALTKIEGLRVAPRTASFQFRGAAHDLREVGRRLRVDTVLEGSVRKAGERLRITAELVDVAAGYDLWSSRYDRRLHDIFEIQDEIAANIVRALQLTLAPGVRRAIGEPPTRVVDAYDYYLRGRKFYNQYRRLGMELALRMFARAIELDTGFALAWAGTADCRAFLYAHAGHHEEQLEEALEASRRALELDPSSAAVRASRAVVLSFGDHPEAADEAFEAALRLDPNLFEATYYYARHCFAQGHFEKAVALYERAAELRPEDYQTPLLMAQVYDDLHRPEDAAAARRRGIRLAEDHLELNPDDNRALYMGANGLVALGERERGLEWARRARELDPEDSMMLYNLACIYSLAGEVESAIECLETCLHHGFSHRDWIEHDSNLDAARHHPRYRPLLDRYRATLPA